MSLEKRIEKLEQATGPTDTPTRADIVAALGRELTPSEAHLVDAWLSGRLAAVAEYDESPDEYEPLLEAWVAAGGYAVKVVYLPRVRAQ